MKRFVDVQSVDDVREEAARCCEETARWQRGERGPLREPAGLIDGEFSDAAFGVAGEVAMVVHKALLTTGVRPRVDLPWTTAAMLIRGGWQRGHKLVPQVIRKGAES